MRRVGLLGGSFDPPHKGHLFISLEAKKILGLSEVWWLITPKNPHKIINPASYNERLYNCRKIVKNYPIKIKEYEKKYGEIKHPKQKTPAQNIKLPDDILPN